MGCCQNWDLENDFQNYEIMNNNTPNGGVLTHNLSKTFSVRGLNHSVKLCLGSSVTHPALLLKWRCYLSLCHCAELDLPSRVFSVLTLKMDLCLLTLFGCKRSHCFPQEWSDQSFGLGGQDRSRLLWLRRSLVGHEVMVKPPEEGGRRQAESQQQGKTDDVTVGNDLVRVTAFPSFIT